MAQPERFEILILGSGKGGKLLAWEMARSGRRTAVVERRTRASDDGGGPRLAVRECAASRCPTDHTKTDRPALMVRSRSDVRARYSLAEGGWAIGRMRVGVGLSFIVLATLGSLSPA